MLKAKDLRDQSIEELEASYTEQCKELYELVNALKLTKKVEKPHLIHQKKKDIARLLTIINEKQSSKQQRAV